jgi:hypothetical protein
MFTWRQTTDNGLHTAKYSLLLLALAATVGLAVTSPAHADRGGRDDHGRGASRERGGGWDHHVRDNSQWRRFHPHEPGYVYAPPAVVYAPPPERSGISLFFPLNIR